MSKCTIAWTSFWTAVLVACAAALTLDTRLWYLAGIAALVCAVMWYWATVSED